MHSWPEVKRVLSGRWALPGLCLVTNSVCDFYGQNLEAKPRCGEYTGTVASALHFSFLQMTWFSWLLQTVTSRVHWDSLRLGVKQRGMKIATSKSAVEQWIALSGWSESLPQVKEFQHTGAVFMSEDKMDRCGVSSYADVILDCCGEEEAEP